MYWINIVKSLDKKISKRNFESQLNSILQGFRKIDDNLKKFLVRKENGIYPQSESEETSMIRKNMYNNFNNQFDELLKDFHILERKIQGLLKIIMIDIYL
jgi:hypothetical protein